jgi:hypothetical protein
MSDESGQARDTPSDEAPDPQLAALIAPLLAGIAEADHPAVIALAERIAADRYREWADQLGDPAAKASLMACAAREDEIATKVEGIVSDADSIQARVRSAHPGIATGYKALFAGLSLSDQLAFQARAERAGAVVWRNTAAGASPGNRPIYLECATLEEASARVLEAMIADGLST